jgi:hypothetical protein
MMMMMMMMMFLVTVLHVDLTCFLCKNFLSKCSHPSIHYLEDEGIYSIIQLYGQLLRECELVARLKVRPAGHEAGLHTHEAVESVVRQICYCAGLLRPGIPKHYICGLGLSDCRTARSPSRRAGDTHNV